MREINKERVATKCVCCGSSNLNKSPAILMPFISARVFSWHPVEVNESWGLNTIKNGMAYSICNSLVCKECNHLFLDIRFTDVEMSNLYRDYRGRAYTELREAFEPGYSVRNEILNTGVRFLSQVESFLTPYLTKPFTVLDWGGDTGINTPFKAEAEKIDIYDISEKDVMSGLERVSLNEAKHKKYSLIICSQVLEHVPYPAEVINSIKDCMNHDSVLYIELPCEELVRNSDDLQGLAVKKKHWHEHINFYNQHSLNALMDYCGFIVIDLVVSKVPVGNAYSYIYQLAVKVKSFN